MGVYIGMEMPKTCLECLLGSIFNGYKCRALNKTFDKYPLDHRMDWCPLIEVPEPHGRLIDADALRAKMYHEAFETDTPMQKWDSGCWIRYKMFEDMEESAPTIIPAESEGE